MGDLYLDDLESKTYTDKMILEDVRALVNSGQREGTLIDYKSDVSEKDTWAPSVAAFANSFGGLIVFGVESKNDQPLRLTGFDPHGVEMKTKLTSMVINRIQPRPDFAVRVVTHDQDPKKEVALLRVEEGRNPPYMYSKDGQHRVYIRIGAQKVEADYLQLSGLLEKRAKNASKAVPSTNEMFGSSSFLHVPTPPEPRGPTETESDYELRVLRGSNLVSSENFRFILSPRNVGPRVRMNFATEHLFWKCIRDVLGAPLNDGPVIRSANATIFQTRDQAYGEQRFGLAAQGGIGFVSFPGIRTGTGVFFVPMDFCRTLMDFICISSLFYERALRFYGSCVLAVSMTSGVVSLFDGFPGFGPNDHLKGTDLFYPPLKVMNVSGAAQIELAIAPMSANRLQDHLEAILTDLARLNGRVLDPRFRGGTRRLVDGSVERLHAARALP